MERQREEDKAPDVCMRTEGKEMKIWQACADTQIIRLNDKVRLALEEINKDVSHNLSCLCFEQPRSKICYTPSPRNFDPIDCPLPIP